jgi:soluble lytic murein transglycosylase
MIWICLTLPACAQDIPAAIRADHWDIALASAAAEPDPVAEKLVTYYRLLAPNVGSARDIDGFMTANPDWPQQELLGRRRDEALVREADDTLAADICNHTHPSLAPALLRCAVAYTQLGQQAPATLAARQAWIAGLATPSAELAFLQRWSSVLRPEDQAQRFDVLAWSDPGSATRQMNRLDETGQALAEARLALHNDAPAALSLLARLTPAQLADPGLFLEHARYLRRAGREAEAVALWCDVGPSVQSATPAAHLPAFWAERNILARRRLRAGDAESAYAVVSAHGQRANEQIAEAEFLAGFIALHFRHDYATATAHFHALQAASTAAITQGRAHYWLARAAGAAGDAATQHAEFTAAAAWPTTYYGQLAALAGGQDLSQLHATLANLHDPVWTPTQSVDFAGRELTRAATMLVAWGEKRRAHAFLLRLEELAPDAADQALTGRLATLFGMPDLAVMIARRAGRAGVMLPQSGWPVPVSVPEGPTPAAVILGVIRQESSFDTGVVSPVGARGLMQLMPATAAAVAKKLGQFAPLPSLTSDPALNIQLGTAYLHDLMIQFGGAVPLAVAAYNAGPNRVVDWLANNGDPRGSQANGPIDMVDWIELIPFDETRNYVQRVSENIAMYTVRQHDPAPLAMADWQKSRPN